MMTQETQTPQAVAVQRGNTPTLALEHGALTDGELALVAGGTDGPPPNTGGHNGHA